MFTIEKLNHAIGRLHSLTTNHTDCSQSVVQGVVTEATDLIADMVDERTRMSDQYANAIADRDGYKAKNNRLREALESSLETSISLLTAAKS